MLFRLAYIAVTNALALMRLLPIRDDKDVEILAFPHQIRVLQRQLGAQRPRGSSPLTEPADQSSQPAGRGSWTTR